MGAAGSINYGGAKHADDKVVQHNGGGTVIINSFYVEDFGKLYRSCGNCKTQYKRAVQVNDVVAKSGKLLAGVNGNYGDSATIRNTKATSVKEVCENFKGNDSGAEPPKVSVGPSSVRRFDLLSFLAACPDERCGTGLPLFHVRYLFVSWTTRPAASLGARQACVQEVERFSFDCYLRIHPVLALLDIFG